MFRIDNASAVASLPAPQAAGTPGYFTRGDSTTGTPPSILSADWANMLQEELMAVVLAASLTPSKTNHAQLLAALRAMFAPLGSTGLSFDGSGNWKRIASDGWVEMGGVLAGLPGIESGFTLTFPFGGFSTQCLGVSGVIINSGSSVDGLSSIQEVSLTKTAASLFVQNHQTAINDAAGGMRWRAWGN